MVKNKINKIIIGLVLLVSISIICAGIVSAYYQKVISGWEQGYSISNIMFSLNGNTDEFNTFHINGNKIDIEEGYSLDLELEVTGSFTGSYAINYNIELQNNKTIGDLSPVIEVYQKVNNDYQYVSMLDELIETGISGYMGINDSTKLSYMLVYSPNAGIAYDSCSFDFTVLASYITESSALHTNRYYISSSMIPTGSTQSLFKLLSSNINDIEDKILTLTEDVQFPINEDIVFTSNVGLDLNGHILDLNGGSITIDYSGQKTKQVAIRNSKDVGEIRNGNITINTPNDVILLDTSLSNNLIIEDISLEKYVSIVQERLNEYEKETLKSNNTYVLVDIIENLETYIYKNIVTLDIFDEMGTIVTQNNIGILEISRPQNTSLEYYTYTTTKGETTKSAYATLKVLGLSAFSLAESLLNAIPTNIKGNIYLPTRDVATNALYTYISSDKSLLNKDGIYLPNGYSNFDNYLDKSLKLSVIVEVNGETINLTKDVNVVIKTLEERINMFIDYDQLIFNEIDQVYMLDITTTLMRKQGLENYQELINYLSTTYGIEVPEYTINSLDQYISTKHSISIIGTDERTLYTEEYEAYLVTNILAEKLGLISTEFIDSTIYTEDNTTMVENVPSHYIDLTNNITYSEDEYTSEGLKMLLRPYQISFEQIISSIYTFKISETNDLTDSITLDKTIIIVGTTNEQEMVDPTNEIKAPFIRYDTRMNVSTNKFETGFNILAKTSDNFPITYRIVFPNNANNYLNITNDGENAYLDIIEGLVPNEDTEISIVAAVQGINYDISFTLPGLLHNESDDILDPSLYFKLLENADENSDGWISRREAERVEELNIEFLNADITKIENLKGIEYFNSLTSLDLSGHSIIDISYLEDMVNLTNLDLSSNLISSIDSLVYLDALETLNLSNNRIIDIKPIEYLIGLKNLHLENNKIVSSEALQNYNSLTYLNVSQNSTINTDDNSRYYLVMAYNNIIKNTGHTPTFTEDANGVLMDISTNEQVAVEVMRNIFITSETYQTLNLPSVYVYNNQTYNISWISGNTAIIDFNSTYPGGYRINKTLIDEDILVSVNVSLEDGLPYRATRKFHINVLQSGAIEDISYIEIEENNYQKLTSIIPDKKLRTLLFNKFNLSQDPDTICYTDPITNCEYSDEIVLTYDEINTSLSETLLFSNAGITDLTGINYFKGITKLQLSGNDINDLSPLQSLANLKTLTLAGKFYEFDQLIYDENNEINNSFNLEALYLDGSFKLDDEETLTSLYHVYRNNKNNATFVKIFLEEEVKTNPSDDYGNNYWDPFKIPLQEFMQSLPHYVAFRNKGDTFTGIDTTYDILFYDDTTPFTFNVQVGSSLIGSFKGLIKIENTTDIVYNKLAYMTDVVYCSIVLKNGVQQINGTTLNITNSESTYIQILLDYKKDEYMIYLDANNILLLGDVFPGRDLRNIVMEKLASQNFEQIDQTKYYTINNQKYVTVKGLKELSVSNSITIYGTVDADTTAVAGLKYLKKVNKVIIKRDFYFGDGSELINLKTIDTNWSCIDLSKLNQQAIIDAAHLIYGNDLSGYADTLEKGYLQVTTFTNTNYVGVLLYDEKEKNNTTDFNNPDKYYLNYFPVVSNISFKRTSSTSGVDIADFRGLRAYISSNNIADLDIHFNNGSMSESTAAILSNIYNNSSATNIGDKYKIGAGSAVITFSPNGVILYSEYEQIVGEYTEFAKYIYDLGVKFDNELTYLSNTQTINNSLYLPKIINPFKVIVKGGDELIIKNPDTIEDYNYREFDISWYVNCSNITTFKAIFPGITVDETPVYTYTSSDTSTSNLKRYKITNFSDTAMAVTKPTYDFYCFFDGVIGDSICGIELSGVTKYAFTYPVLIKGITSYDTNNEYRYTINNDTYYSFGQIKDFAIRLAMYIGIDGRYNNKSSDIGGLLRYSYDNNTNGAKLITKVKLTSNNITFSNNDSINISNSNYNNILNSLGASKGFKNNIYGGITLDGLEIFNNIEDIEINGYNIADITALASMPNLKNVNLGSNAINDISAFKTLSNLINVNLSSNNINKSYYETQDQYISLFANSRSSLTTLNLSNNSGITDIDILCLTGNVNKTTKEVSATSNKLSILTVNNIQDQYQFSVINAVSKIVDNTTGTNMSIIMGNQTTAISDTVDNMMIKFNQLSTAYQNAKSNTYQYNTTDFSMGLGLPTRLSNENIGSLTSNGTLVFNSDYLSSMNAIQGTFVVDIIYTQNFASGNLDVVIPYQCYIDLSRQDREIYVKFGGINSDLYQENGVNIGAADIFDPNLLLYFISQAEYTTNGTGDSNILLYEDSTNNMTILIFKNTYTSLDINADYNRFITSLKGVELIGSLETIIIKGNGITILPNFTSSNNNINSILLECSGETPALLKVSELQKLIPLDNLSTLKLVNYDGEFDKTMSNGISFMAYIASLQTINDITMHVGSKIYVYEDITIGGNTYQKINYQNTIQRIQDYLKTPTSIDQAKLFGLSTSKLMSSYGELYVNEVITGSNKTNKTNLIDNVYTKIMYNYYESYSDTKINIGTSELTNYNSYNIKTLFPYIFSMTYSSDNLDIVKKRSLELGFLNVQTYNLPIEAYVNGYKYTINWSMSSVTGVTLTSNAIKIASNAVKTANITSTVKCLPLSINNTVTINIDGSNPEQETNSILGDCFVEIAPNVYKKANDVFVSGRLIYNLFNNKYKTYESRSLNTNGTSDRGTQTFTIDGESYTAENRYILSQTEINSVTSIKMDNPGVTSLVGMEYYTEIIKFRFTANALTSLDPLKDLQLEVLEYTSAATDLYVNVFDFSFLYNSRNTLKKFRYNMKEGQGTYANFNYIDFDFLTSFGEQLTDIQITGNTGTKSLQNIKYLVTWFLINRGISVKVFESNGTDGVVYISSGDKKAMNVLNQFVTTDQTITSNFESFLTLTEDNGKLVGYLPDYINYGGINYTISWEKFCSYMNVTYDDTTHLYYVEISEYQKNRIGQSHIACLITIDDVQYSRIFTIDY